jgi:hypothetical protein
MFTGTYFNIFFLGRPKMATLSCSERPQGKSEFSFLIPIMYWGGQMYPQKFRKFLQYYTQIPNELFRSQKPAVGFQFKKKKLSKSRHERSVRQFYVL